MTLTDWFLTLPSLPLAISLAAVIGQGATSITIAIAATSWTGTARLVRAQTLAVEARPFVERARAAGLRKYGFHGLSYRFVCREVGEALAAAAAAASQPSRFRVARVATCLRGGAMTNRYQIARV